MPALPKKQPKRMCVACRCMQEKRMLIRFVKTGDGEVAYDPSGKEPGRGAYICRNDGCFERAKKIRALERALDAKPDWKKLEEAISAYDGGR